MRFIPVFRIVLHFELSPVPVLFDLLCRRIVLERTLSDRFLLRLVFFSFDRFPEVFPKHKTLWNSADHQ